MLYVLNFTRESGLPVQVHSTEPPVHYENCGDHDIDITFTKGPVCTLTYENSDAPWWIVEQDSPSFIKPGTSSSSEMTIITIDPAITEATFTYAPAPFTKNKITNLAGATGVVIGDGSSQTNVFY